MLYILIILLQPTQTQTYSQLQSTTTTIHTSATYQIQLYTSTINIPTNSILQLSFPPQYSLSQTTYPCSYVSQFQQTYWTNQPTITCSRSGNSILITNGFPLQINSNFNAVFSIDTITNPKAVATYAIQLQIKELPSNVIITQSLNLQITRGSLSIYKQSACNIDFINPTVSTYTDIEITLTPQVEFQTSEIVKLRVQNQVWETQVGLDNNRVWGLSQSCESISNANPGVSCRIQNDGQNYLQVSSLIASLTTNAVKFKYQQMLAPPSLQPMSVRIESINEECTVVVESSIPKGIQNLTVQASNETIGALSSLVFVFESSSHFGRQDVIQIDFENDVGLNRLFSISKAGSNLPFYIDANKLTIEKFLTSPSNPAQYNITMMWLVLPPSIKELSFTISCKRNTYLVDKGTLTAFKSSPEILDCEIQALNGIVSQTTVYRISVNLTNPIKQNGQLYVLFPNQFHIPDNTADCLHVQGLYTLATAGCSFTSNLLKIDRIFSAIPLINNQIRIEVGGIKNPIVPGIYKVQIESIYQNGGSVVEKSQKDVTIVKSQGRVSVNANAKILQIDSLQLDYQNRVAIQIGDYLQIDIPTDFTITSSYTLLIATQTRTTSLNTNTIQISPQTSSFPIASMPLIKINHIRNPSSGQPTDFITIKLFTSSNLKEESKVRFKASVGLQLDNKKVVFSNRNGSQLSDISFSFESKQGIPIQSQIKFIFPYSLQIKSQTTCSPIKGVVSLRCTTKGNQVIAEIGSTIAPAAQTQIKINSIKNRDFSVNNQKVQIQIYNKNKYILNQDQILIPQNNISPLQATLYQFTPLQTPTSLFLKIVPNTLLPPFQNTTLPGNIKITIPSEYSIGTLSCKVWGVDGSSCTLISGVVIITGSKFELIIYVKLQGITSPSAATSTPWRIQTYTSQNNPIQLSNSIIFSPKCPSPCKSCFSNQTNKCTQCYSGSASLYQLSSQTCVSICPSTFYENDDKICIECDSNCRKCQKLSDNCTQCSSSMVLVDNKCYNGCPQQYYTSTKCQPCIGNCLNCNSDTQCISCKEGFYLNEKRCESSCPDGLTPVDSIRQCRMCPSNCGQCSDQNICTECNTNYYLQNSKCGQKCLSPTSYPNPTSFQCQPCQSPCLVCQNTSTTCTQCSPTAFLYQDTCINGSCPVTYYADVNRVCQHCKIECSQCTQQNVCTRCVSGSSLFKNQCFLQCEKGWTSINNICQQCESPCLQCQISKTSCSNCVQNYLFYNNDCILNCPTQIPQLYQHQKQCVTCISPCKQCQILPTLCTQCISNYYLLGQYCYTQCPQGYYQDAGSTSCSQCNYTKCRTCDSGPTDCIVCQDTQVSLNGDCINSCPQPYFNFNRVCTLCKPECSNCLSLPTQCSACVSTKLYNQITKTCLDSCQNGYYQNQSQCITCQPPCKLCDSTFNHCIACLEGFYLFNTKCQSYCPSGYYQEQKQDKCQSCPSQCAQCNSSTYCTSCNAGYSYFQRRCSFICPAQAPNSINGYCSDCVDLSKCSKCVQGNKCSNCIDGFYVFDNECIQECPSNYQVNDQKTECVWTKDYAVYLAQQALQRNKTLPFTYTHFATIFSLTYSLTYLQTPKPLLLPAMVTAFGLMQYFASIHNIAYIINYDMIGFSLYFILSGVVALLIFNSLTVLSIWKINHKDQLYKEWLSQQYNRQIQKIIIGVSLFTSFKFSHILFSRYFNIPCFSYRMKSIFKLWSVNLLSFISIFLVSTPLIIGGVLLAIQQYPIVSKIFLMAVELVILSTICLILQIFELRRDESGYFRQKQVDHMDGLSKQVNLSSWCPLQQIEDVQQKHIKTLQVEHDRGQIQKIEYYSMFNAYEYADVPKMANEDIVKGIEEGVFRKRQKNWYQKQYNIEEKRRQKKKTTFKTKKKKKMKKKKGKGNIDDLLYVPNQEARELARSKNQNIPIFKHQNLSKYFEIPNTILKRDQSIQIQRADSILNKKSFFNVMNPDNYKHGTIFPQ